MAQATRRRLGYRNTKEKKKTKTVQQCMYMKYCMRFHRAEAVLLPARSSENPLKVTDLTLAKM